MEADVHVPTRKRRSVGIIGMGRAGRSFDQILRERGWTVHTLSHAQVDSASLGSLARTVELILLCVPDQAIVETVARWSESELGPDVVVAHCSGALGIEVLAPALRRAAIHPLVSLNGSDPDRLIGAYFAVQGDPIALELVESLDGRAFEVSDDFRPLYHAAAAIASNHLVALMDQVAVIAELIGVPLAAYRDLAVGSLNSVVELGSAAALTGPVSRGDWATVEAHLDALSSNGLHREVGLYLTLARRAAELAGREVAQIDGLAERYKSVIGGG